VWNRQHELLTGVCGTDVNYFLLSPCSLLYNTDTKEVIVVFALEFPFSDGEEWQLQTETLNLPSVETSDLLKYYGFDLSDQTSEKIVAQWLEQYPPDWILWAILEALYQGRYKAISVEQLLIYWQRRGEPIYHFPSDFEHLICYHLPQNLLGESQKPGTPPTHQLMESTTEETDETDRLSLKHPDFYRKLKGFMNDL
jgi:hypothetical protein